MSPDREEEKAMMQDPMRWPHIVLPVKRRREGQSWPDVGIMLVSRVDAELKGVVKPEVYLRSLYDKEPLSETEIIQYPDFDALLDDGWVVD
jgi:hypothetical protein